jgi:hypothetical protein
LAWCGVAFMFTSVRIDIDAHCLQYQTLPVVGYDHQLVLTPGRRAGIGHCCTMVARKQYIIMAHPLCAGIYRPMNCRLHSVSVVSAWTEMPAALTRRKTLFDRACNRQCRQKGRVRIGSG